MIIILLTLPYLMNLSFQLGTIEEDINFILDKMHEKEVYQDYFNTYSGYHNADPGYLNFYIQDTSEKHFIISEDKNEDRKYTNGTKEGNKNVPNQLINHDYMVGREQTKKRPFVNKTSTEFITIHDTGNDKQGANALAHAKYLITGDATTSWHFTVDDNEIYQHMPLDEAAHHAGDGTRDFGLSDTGVVYTIEKPELYFNENDHMLYINGEKSVIIAPNDGVTYYHSITPAGLYIERGENGNYWINNFYHNTDYDKVSNMGGNYNSIGIETCINYGIFYSKVMKKLSNLVVRLLDYYNLGTNRVLKHQHFSGKHCPGSMIDANKGKMFDFNRLLFYIETEYFIMKNLPGAKFTYVSKTSDLLNEQGQLLKYVQSNTEIEYEVTVEYQNVKITKEYKTIIHPVKDPEIKISVLYDFKSKSFIISNNYDDPNYIAKGRYSDTNQVKGTDTLSITTNPIYSDLMQSEAAGHVEGYLTRVPIYDHYRNMKSFMGDLKPEVIKFLLEQEQYIQKKFKENPNDPYVYLSYLVYLQLKGLREEYNKNMPNNPLEDIDFIMMTAFGDLFDINAKYDGLDYTKLSRLELRNHFLRTNHCSAVFKATKNFDDIFFGHNSWYIYSMMRRILKEYNFNFNHPNVKAKNIIFSSYPSTLSSNDDFYITSQKLAVIETTNDILNKTLYDKLTPESFLCYQRVMVANRMSSNAKEWGEHFKQYNSGTYNNQYMVLDMKKVNLSQNIIEDESFFITETIPGYVAINDVTNFLKFGYWPSYNIPFDKKIKEMSQMTVKLNPNMIGTDEWSNYDTCSRAKIFRRDQSDISNISEFKKFIRSNNYLNEKLSSSACFTISARCELDTDQPQCMGAYDAKIASVKEILNGFNGFHFISGPTDDGVPKFSTKNCTSCGENTYYGIAEVPNYDWIYFKAKEEF